MNPDGVYVAIWEFTARPDARQEFENFYGPDGAWVQLFRRSKSFLRTELFRDRNAENHYVTMDCFSSKEGYDDFLRQFRQEYDALDRRCERLREGQKEIGVFLALGGSSFQARA